MLSASFALKLFEAFSIERWNDLVRPFALVEMDKAGEKMVLAYIIGKYEEQEGKKVDWHWMIYASIFDLLKRIALCDIKSPVQRMIRTRYPEEYKKLIWEDIKNINKELPTYKHIKEISITTDPLEKTTTQKVKRYVEMKKMETAK